jgi:hypothetical protein
MVTSGFDIYEAVFKVNFKTMPFPKQLDCDNSVSIYLARFLVFAHDFIDLFHFRNKVYLNLIYDCNNLTLSVS